ncbi:MAG: TlyA family RNA methyltransferase [Acidobacteria bacterium]|jgi:23S rRNA (cytidine1920-2'-O)/16S rRNA (cytidine1409-2'-O)-methyltransferase|nr:TlyA family RNA methyltransferase [Acidobacteriota bacterium]
MAESRQKAQAIILAGQLYSGERRIEKPGQLLPDDVPLELRGPKCPFVSRGGMKLDGAMEDLGIDVSGLDCLDVGASTGGFTDCLLQRGARRVVALDVGHGQLDARLRSDPRITSLEGVNARHLKQEMLPFNPDFVVVDASFISLKLLLPAILCSAPKARLLALVKPQFEVGRGRVGRGGVVRGEEEQQAAVDGIIAAAQLLGYTVKGVAKSHLKGPKGNQEYFLYLIPAKKGAPK